VLINSGGVFVATARVKLSAAVEVPSLTVMVTTTVPAIARVGVRVSVRKLPLPPKVMALAGSSAEFEDALPSVSVPTGVSGSPVRNGTGPTATPLSVRRLRMSEMVGGSSLAVTDTVMGAEEISAPSVMAYRNVST